MRQFTVKTKVNADPDAIYSTILNVEDFPKYINGVREMKRIGTANNGFEEISALISLRYFTGRVAAHVNGNPADRTVSVQFTKGPFQLAKTTIEIVPSQPSGVCELTYNVQYATPIALYTSLIERHRQSALERISSLFAKRSQIV